MKRFLIATCLPLGLTTASHAALVVDYQYDDAPASPVIDGAVASDPTVGNVDNGTLNGSATYSAGSSRGAAGTHASFANGFVDLTDDSDPTDTTQDALRNTPGATLLTDFRLDRLGDSNTVRVIYFSRGTSVGNARAELVFNFNSSDQTYSFSAGARSADTDGFRNVTSSRVNVVAGQWHSVAAVFDYAGDEISIFFDGNQIGSGSVPFVAATTSNTDSLNARIGSDHDGPFFVGDLDNTLIYNEALSDAAAQSATLIPEPGTLLLVGLGGVFALCRRGRCTA